jgi:membrane-associated phospholipid phosphatase
MASPHQFRPPGPPPLDSDAFRRARAAVAAIGGAVSTARTAEQTEIARYWNDGTGSYALAGHWNAIAAAVLAPMGLGLEDEARRFAELNVALADAAIAVADAKYAFWFWRPVTAIRSGAGGGDWTPLLGTPDQPSYVSGHAVLSGAAASVLAGRLGERSFRFAGDSLPGVSREFAGFGQAAREAADSRVYGGIHYPFDSADGLAAGKAIGAWTLSAFDRPGDDRGPFLMMAESKETHAVTGCALDNLAPVLMVMARLDGGEPFSVAVDDKGRFAVPPLRAGGSGRHEIAVTATSKSGRTGFARLEIAGDNADAVPPPGK